jgi:hypothetical protein
MKIQSPEISHFSRMAVWCLDIQVATTAQAGHIPACKDTERNICPNAKIDGVTIQKDVD